MHTIRHQLVRAAIVTTASRCSLSRPHPDSVSESDDCKSGSTPKKTADHTQLLGCRCAADRCLFDRTRTVVEGGVIALRRRHASYQIGRGRIA